MKNFTLNTVAAVLIALFTTSIASAQTSGSLTDNITWTIDNDGNLLVTGSGDIPDYALFDDPFSSYNTQIKTITVSGDITSIGRNTFYAIDCATKATINAPITTIRPSAFYFASSLKTVEFVNTDKLESIEQEAFAFCTDMESITIPKSVKTIGTAAFMAVGKITSITIPENVTTIGANAFNVCPELTTVEIGKSVTSIGDGAFSGCTKISTVTSLNTTPPSMSDDHGTDNDNRVFDASVYANATFKAYEGETWQKYKEADGWKNFTFKDSNKISGIEEASAEAGIEVYGTNGEITVSGAAESDAVAVYTIAGQQIYRGMKKTIAAAPGIYIVRTAGRSFKTIVK